VLASASPRRAALLAAAGVDCEVVPADVDERALPGESADGHVSRLALAKAAAVAAHRKGQLVLGADTVVVVDGAILGKPADDRDAIAMLERLSGRAHDVLTGVCLFAAGPVRQSVERSRVTFARLSPDEIAWYVASGEPRDKAGAYAIQGLGSRFVTGVEGSYCNVVGLPVSTVYAWLRELQG